MYEKTIDNAGTTWKEKQKQNVRPKGRIGAYKVSNVTTDNLSGLMPIRTPGNHRRPEGGGNLGQLPPPLEFENDDVICCSRGNYPKMLSHQIPLN